MPVKILDNKISDNKLSAITSAGYNRGKAPVFVLGCPRSGTTLLYHMLLSAGGFAVYRTESNVFNLLAPRFGGMRSESDRRQLMQYWLGSMLFRRSGLDARQIEQSIIEECRGPGDFLRLVMEAIAGTQNVPRWADCTPEHLLYMEEIKQQLPDALFIHIIRDARDVALSYVKQGWSHPLPWDRQEHLAVAGLYWEWMVRQGREQGKALGLDYQEVRFEDLVDHPQGTLSQLSEFIEQDLDPDRIRNVAIGSVSQPNSSFKDEPVKGFNPVGRWKTKLSSEEAADFELVVGDFLRELQYPVESPKRWSLRALRLRGTYFSLFESKRWARQNTPLRKLIQLGHIEIRTDPPPTEKLQQHQNTTDLRQA